MNLLDATIALQDMSIALTLTEKSIASVAKRFRSDLRNLAVLGFVSDSSILADVRRLVKQAVEDAYVEGLAEGNVSADEMSEDDALMIIELNTNQQDYVTDFVRAIREAKGDKVLQRNILDTRVDLWAASIEAAGMQGLASAKANEMVVWRLGSTEEHCRTCRQLDGQRHRRKWFADRNYFPQTPGADLECGGFNCLCVLK